MKKTEKSANKYFKKDLRYVNMEFDPEFKLCVSISSGGYMSLSWTEHFFKVEDDGNQFEKEARRQGYAVLTADPDSY